MHGGLWRQCKGAVRKQHGEIVKMSFRGVGDAMRSRVDGGDGEGPSQNEPSATDGAHDARDGNGANDCHDVAVAAPSEAAMLLARVDALAPRCRASAQRCLVGKFNFQLREAVLAELLELCGAPSVRRLVDDRVKQRRKLAARAHEMKPSYLEEGETRHRQSFAFVVRKDLESLIEGCIDRKHVSKVKRGGRDGAGLSGTGAGGTVSGRRGSDGSRSSSHDTATATGTGKDVAASAIREKRCAWLEECRVKTVAALRSRKLVKDMDTAVLVCNGAPLEQCEAQLLELVGVQRRTYTGTASPSKRNRRASAAADNPVPSWYAELDLRIRGHKVSADELENRTMVMMHIMLDLIEGVYRTVPLEKALSSAYGQSGGPSASSRSRSGSPAGRDQRESPSPEMECDLQGDVDGKGDAARVKRTQRTAFSGAEKRKSSVLRDAVVSERVENSARRQSLSKRPAWVDVDGCEGTGDGERGGQDSGRTSWMVPEDVGILGSGEDADNELVRDACDLALSGQQDNVGRDARTNKRQSISSKQKRVQQPPGSTTSAASALLARRTGVSDVEWRAEVRRLVLVQQRLERELLDARMQIQDYVSGAATGVLVGLHGARGHGHHEHTTAVGHEYRSRFLRARNYQLERFSSSCENVSASQHCALTHACGAMEAAATHLTNDLTAMSKRQAGATDKERSAYNDAMSAVRGALLHVGEARKRCRDGLRSSMLEAAGSVVMDTDVDCAVGSFGTLFRSIERDGAGGGRAKGPEMSSKGSNSSPSRGNRAALCEVYHSNIGMDRFPTTTCGPRGLAARFARSSSAPKAGGSVKDLEAPAMSKCGPGPQRYPVSLPAMARAVKVRQVGRNGSATGEENTCVVWCHRCATSRIFECVRALLTW